mmetsp:Transcript_16636/g.34129  ORF Transcript_16636/g.34129 Transcript_16636/m.34129 type:complete len:93 (-) Transcript_16636:383-661(-)
MDNPSYMDSINFGAEHLASPQYVQINKNSDKDWFQVESNKTGLRWSGKCWYFHDKVRNGTSKSVHYLELTRFTFLNPMIRSATSLIWSLRFR